MFPSHAEQQSAIGSQLLAALDAYEKELALLADDPRDVARHAALARHFDDMHRYAASLPQLSMSWVALLISRAEYAHLLWTATRDSQAKVDIQAQLAQHRGAIASLRARCERLLRRN